MSAWTDFRDGIVDSLKLSQNIDICPAIVYYDSGYLDLIIAFV